jgi:hypothetical protein
MASRQERRQLERLAKKPKAPEGPAIPAQAVQQVWDSVSTEEQEMSVQTDVKYLRAPRGLPNIRQNTQLKVIKAFLTPASCPHGAGLTCYETEKSFRAVDVPGKGLAWMKK